MPANKRKFNLFFTLAKAMLMMGVFALFSCGKKNDVPPPPRNLPPVTAPTPVAAESKEKPVYVYSGDRYRDIFTPVGASANYQAEAVFDPQKISVRGIIFSPRYKSAVLSVTGSGTFFVKEGRIFDIMGKTVKGYSAKILVDRVVLMNDSDNTFEIKLKKDSNDLEEAKTL